MVMESVRLDYNNKDHIITSMTKRDHSKNNRRNGKLLLAITAPLSIDFSEFYRQSRSIIQD